LNICTLLLAGQSLVPICAGIFLRMLNHPIAGLLKASQFQCRSFSVLGQGDAKAFICNGWMPIWLKDINRDWMQKSCIIFDVLNSKSEDK